MTIQALAQLLRRHFVIIGVFLVLGLGAGFGVTQVMPKTYSATTTQFVRGIPGTGTGAEYQAAQFATSRAKSYPVMIGNPDLLNAVITELGLNISTTELSSMLTVDNPTDTSVINVTARASSADLAQSISISAADNLAKLILRLESAGAAGKSPVDIQTAVPALKPGSPTSPKLTVNVGLGGAVGLALGILAALAYDARRRRGLAAPGGRHVDDVLPGSPNAAASTPASTSGSTPLARTASGGSDPRASEVESAVDPLEKTEAADAVEKIEAVEPAELVEPAEPVDRAEPVESGEQSRRGTEVAGPAEPRRSAAARRRAAVAARRAGRSN